MQHTPHNPEATVDALMPRLLERAGLKTLIHASDAQKTKALRAYVAIKVEDGALDKVVGDALEKDIQSYAEKNRGHKFHNSRIVHRLIQEAPSLSAELQQIFPDEHPTRYNHLQELLRASQERAIRELKERRPFNTPQRARTIILGFITEMQAEGRLTTEQANHIMQAGKLTEAAQTDHWYWEKANQDMLKELRAVSAEMANTLEERLSRPRSDRPR